MKLQLKILLVIIPFVLLSLLALGLWSFHEARENIYQSAYRYLDIVLDSYIDEQIRQNYQLLKDARLAHVSSYAKSYQQEVQNHAKGISQTRGGHIFILNEDGTMIFSSLGHDPGAMKASWQNESYDVLNKSRGEIVQGHIENKVYNDIYVARYFKPWGWVVFYSVSDAANHASVNKILLVTFGMIVLCALGGSFLIYIASRVYLVRPIDKLKDAAAQIASRQRIVTIDVNTTDELGELARGMENTSKAIHQYRNDTEQAKKTLQEKNAELEKSQQELKYHQESLEQLIEDRTFELSDANKQLRQEIIERNQVESQQRETKERLFKFMNSATDGFILFDSELYHLEMNKAALEITGLKRIDVIGKNLIDVLPNIKDTPRYNAYKKVMKTGEPFQVNDITQHPLTGDKNIELKAFKVGKGLGIIFTDVTERVEAEKEKEKLESQIGQAQKMESIGTLAGGIAHDFNNILFPIIGHTEILLEDAPEEGFFKDSLNEIYTSALRAAELVKQILTFSRQEKSELKLMKMQSIVNEALKLIRSTIPTTIEIKQNISPDCSVIKADPTQIHQIVMNLATNAYHAMEETGGTLTVTLKETQFDELDVPNIEITPGNYASLTVSDTGTGMTKELTKKIFDPFYTTKETGKGSGLGLSVVHGIVKNTGGSIHVYSEPGRGTEFRVFLPIARSFSSEKVDSLVEAIILRGTERVLLVDDEEAIIKMERQMLERLGYQVTSSSSSLEALEIFRGDPDKFDLVITDMAMPKLSGDKLTAELKKIRSDIPVLLCTGFSEVIPEEMASSLGIGGFLMKPIIAADLSKKIREVLDEAQG